MAEEINKNLDTTPLPPNNLVAQDPQSAELAGYVRTKTFGRDVRESIARSIELNSTRSKSAEELASETVNVANDLTERFNAQIDALTEDSEVIDARGDKATLGQRLDVDKSEIEGKITTARELIVNVESKTPIVTKVSAYDMSELRDLCSDYSTPIRLDVDQDLIIDDEDFVMKNVHAFTNNGSRIFIDNNYQLVISTRSSIQDFMVVSTNDSKAAMRIEKATESASPVRINVGKLSYYGNPNCNADIFEIVAAETGMIGVTIQEVTGDNARAIFNFTFLSETAWCNGNVFKDIFVAKVRTGVKVTGGSDASKTSNFAGNLFDNVMANASDVYESFSNDKGLNRYERIWVYDAHIYNNSPQINKTGIIHGGIRNSYLSKSVEFPSVAIIRPKGNYYRLGYFNVQHPTTETFAKICFYGPVYGVGYIFVLSSTFEGKLSIKSKTDRGLTHFEFKTATMTDGSVALFCKYTGPAWVMPSYHERIGFEIDHAGAMMFTDAQVAGINLADMEVKLDANIL